MPNTEREEKNVRKKGRVFVKDGHPVGFFLNPNIKGHGQREQLRANIEVHCSFLLITPHKTNARNSAPAGLRGSRR